MYPSHLGAGDRVDFVEPPAEGPILGYSHEAVATMLKQRQADNRPIGERINLYGYVMNNPVNNTDPSGLATVCGPRVWLYTGSWCIDEIHWQAAIEAAGRVVTCWWECEVTTHKCVAGKILTTVEVVGGTVAGLAARVPKGPTELLSPNTLFTGPAKSFRLANPDQLKSLLRPILSRGFARSGLAAGARGAVVVTALIEAGISISCGYSCSD